MRPLTMPIIAHVLLLLGVATARPLVYQATVGSSGDPLYADLVDLSSNGDVTGEYLMRLLGDDDGDRTSFAYVDLLPSNVAAVEGRDEDDDEDDPRLQPIMVSDADVPSATSKRSPWAPSEIRVDEFRQKLLRSRQYNNRDKHSKRDSSTQRLGSLFARAGRSTAAGGPPPIQQHPRRPSSTTIDDLIRALVRYDSAVGMQRPSDAAVLREDHFGDVTTGSKMAPFSFDIKDWLASGPTSKVMNYKLLRYLRDDPLRYVDVDSNEANRIARIYLEILERTAENDEILLPRTKTANDVDYIKILRKMLS